MNPPPGKTLRSLIVIGSLALSLATTPLSGGESAHKKQPNWPRFRGPEGAGVSDSTAIPLQWSHRDYLWRVKLPGHGHSSPVVWGDRLYVTAAEQTDATRLIRCLDVSDGATVWQRSFGSPQFDLGNATAYDAATPVVDKERVYMAWAAPGECIIQAIDRTDGRPLWRRDLGPYNSEHGHATSPIVWRDLLILMNDQKDDASVVALDTRTGETRWETTRQCEKAAYSTPFIWQPDGAGPQLITSGWGPGIVAYDPASGRTLWRLPVFKARCVGSPVAAVGLIFAQSGSGGGGKQFFAVRPGVPKRNSDAEVAYEVTGSLPYVPTPIAHGELVFLWSDSGVVQCIDATSGERLWRERVAGRYFGSPVRVGDRLYCMSREGQMVILAATRDFRELARIDLGEGSHSTPAIADGVMYLRTFTHLMAIGDAGVEQPTTDE